MFASFSGHFAITRTPPAGGGLHIVQVIKRQVAGRARKLIAVERRLVHGCVQVAEQIMLATQTQLGVINTAYIERLQATLRGWLPMAFRRTRCPARSADRVEDALFWTGVVYNL
jgi:hypothetical protein